MNNSVKISVLIGFLSFILMYGGMILYSHTVGYPVFLDNCDSILSTDYNVATEDVSECLRAINHPFVNYWMEIYVVFGVFSLMISGLIGFVVLGLREM